MLKIYLILLIPIITASAAQLLFKKGISSFGSLDLSLNNFISLIPRVLQNVWLVSGMVLFSLSFLVYLFVLSKLQLNVAYPIMVSAGIIIISLASWLLFKETLSWPQILGIVVIIFGIFLLAVKS